MKLVRWSVEHSHLGLGSLVAAENQISRDDKHNESLRHLNVRLLKFQRPHTFFFLKAEHESKYFVLFKGAGFTKGPMDLVDWKIKCSEVV